MKVELPGKLIRDIVKAAVGIVSSSDERQILHNVLMEADDDGFHVTATDTIVGLWRTIGKSDHTVIGKNGRAAVNAQQLLRVLDTIANKTVTISCTGRSCSVTATGARFRLHVEDPTEYPKISRFSLRRPYITARADVLTKMMARTAHCAHDEESIQLMHGLLLFAESGAIHMVATDGQRLAITKAAFESGSPSDHDFADRAIIPAALAPTIKRIMTRDVTTIDIQWMANHVNFRTTDGEVSIRALAGSYPPYGMGIPTNLRQIKIDRRDLIEVLRQTTALKSLTANFVSLTFEADKMVFKSIAEGAGESHVDYDFVWNHEPLTLTINPDFMLKTLTSISGDSALLEIGNEMTPTIIREQNDEDSIESFCVYAVVRQ